jgi:hypothetical protein
MARRGRGRILRERGKRHGSRKPLDREVQEMRGRREDYRMYVQSIARGIERLMNFMNGGGRCKIRECDDDDIVQR